MFDRIFAEILDGSITIDKLKNISGIYPSSIYEKDNSYLFLVKLDDSKSLVVLKKSNILDKFEGEPILDENGKICPLNHHNSVILRELFPFTSPQSHKNHHITIGLGDRLGLASPGHLRLTNKYKFFPVIAQQSIRELNLTNRSYSDVLDAASWAAFQEGYEEGFGFDGDHLKTDGEIQMALDNGATMITLDCSEYINNSVYDMTQEEVDKKYLMISEEVRDMLEDKYLNKNFKIENDFIIKFSPEDLKRIILIYNDALIYAINVFYKFILPLGDNIDFEISIDETLYTTSVEAHYLVASELIDHEVKVRSLAPRFIGEFQKGIDYIGDVNEFEKEFLKHFQISKHFGYKLSIHSGSDKFSVFPIIGKATNGCYHLKTAGTNWLEAIRIVAIKNPELFREIYNFAIDKLDEAKKYYHVNVDRSHGISIEELSDEELVNLLDDNNIRQIIHITYGLILQEEDEDNILVLKKRLYKLLNKYEEDYYEALYKHIGKHLELLKVKLGE
jgi:hypothetical protein